MTRDEINKYTELKVTLEQKRDEYEESVYDLKAELDRRKAAYELSVKDLVDEKEQLCQQIIDKAYDILHKIEKILIDRIGYYKDWTIAEEEFGVIINKDDDSEYSPGLRSKINCIESISSSYIDFSVDQDLRDGDYASGTISIPIKYFELIDILDNEDYLNDVFEGVKQRNISCAELRKLEKIAELEAEITRLKESND